MQNKTQIQAEARLRMLASQGDPFAKSYLYGYGVYAEDPLGFNRDHLKASFTNDIERVIQSVKDNQVTIAISANATGKSYAAAHIAVWYYKAFDGSKVFLAAAPPESNLRQILWLEIEEIARRNPHIFSNDKIRQDLMIKRNNSKSFISGLVIPTTGSSADREAKFCADAEDYFEMNDGALVRYKDLVGRNDIPVVSVNDGLERELEFAEAFDNGEKDVFELTLDDGEVICRTGNHPVYTGWDIGPDHHVYPEMGHKKGQIRARQEGWKEIENISIGDAVLGPESTDFNFGEKEIDENLVKFLAYMIGDGSFTQRRGSGNILQFTQSRNKQLEEFIRILKNIGVDYTVSDLDKYNWVCISIHNSGLADFSRECRLHGLGSKDKFIPNIVFSLSARQISIFLSRLFATDGWASLSNKAEIGYCSKSAKLVRDVQRLLKRFGIRAKIVSKKIKWKTNGDDRSGVYWTLYISNSVDVIKFVEKIGIYGKEENLERCFQYAKNTKWRHANWKFEHTGYTWRRIVKIRKLGVRPTVGIFVPKNHTYLTSLIEHNSGKHDPYTLFVIDEADAVPAEVFKGIESCMSGGHARLLIMFNPRADRGYVANMVKHKRGNIIHLSAFDHPNVVSGEDKIPGAVTRQKTIQRINTMTTPLPPGMEEGISTFRVPDYLVGETTVDEAGLPYPPLPPGPRRVVNHEFFYKVIGVYPPQAEDQLISRVDVDKAISRYKTYIATYGKVPPMPNMIPTCAVDVADLGGDFNVLAYRYGNWIPELKVWEGMDPDTAFVKVAEDIKKNHPNDFSLVPVNIDSTGVGAGGRKRLQGLGFKKANRVMVAEKPNYKPTKKEEEEKIDFFQLRDQLWWQTMIWLRDDPGAMLPDDQDLADELCTPIYWKGERDGKIRVSSRETMISLLGRSPDRASALILLNAPIANGVWTQAY